MDSFDRRKDGFERKFAHDEELRFRATARRNRLLGHWAAEKLGLAPNWAAWGTAGLGGAVAMTATRPMVRQVAIGVGADAYARDVVNADFAVPGDQDVFAKLRGDFDAGKVAVSDHQLRHTMDELLAVAVEQIQGER